MVDLFQDGRSESAWPSLTPKKHCHIRGVNSTIALVQGDLPCLHEGTFIEQYERHLSPQLQRGKPKRAIKLGQHPR